MTVDERKVYVVSCDGCGTFVQQTDQAPPVGWTTTVVQRHGSKARHYCPGCWMAMEAAASNRASEVTPPAKPRTTTKERLQSFVRNPCARCGHAENDHDGQQVPPLPRPCRQPDFTGAICDCPNYEEKR